MALSKRENIIIIAALAAVVLLVLDNAVLSPFLERGAAIQTEKQGVLDQLNQAHALFSRRKQLIPVWKEIVANGLKSNPAEAESQALHAIRNWSQETGFAVSSLRSESSRIHNNLQEIVIQTSGTGSMRSIALLLWRLESSSLPLRVKDMQLSSRRDGADDLAVQLRVSTICDARGSTEEDTR